MVGRGGGGCDAWLDIAERNSGAIRLTAAEAQPEPRNLRRIKGEVSRRWGIVTLIDMLKEAVLRTGCLDAVTSVSGGGSLSAEVLAERLLLVIYAYGTNTGIKAVASGGHGHTEDELRHVRRRYLRRGRPRHRHRDRERHLRRPQHRAVGPGLDRGRLMETRLDLAAVTLPGPRAPVDADDQQPAAHG
nr:Tn3 family transposase [Streptomyces sp. NBC_00830]